MKVSVIVPTLNEECYLEINLISVRKQTYGEIELIVSNGKSEDRTVKIAGKYKDMIETAGHLKLLPSDSIIALTCRYHGIDVILTFDEDFKRIPWLQAIP